MDSKKVKILLLVKCLIVVLIILLSFLLYLKFNIDEIRPTFYLLGPEEITLSVGSEYKEPGYVATFNNKDYKNNVSVISNLNNEKIGNYVISYTMNIKFFQLSKTIQRKVKVVDLVKPEIKVNSADVVEVRQYSTYQASIAKAKDNYDGDLSSKVQIKSNVDTSVPGEYYVKYEVSDSSKNKSKKEIKVKVNGKNPYIDISISEQTLNYYEYGEVVLSSYVVTGINDGTPIGNYSVLYKARDVMLKGDDYESHVDYWMAFLGHSYGLHDASWRSQFGGNIYRYNGSHGCVNMPYSKIASLYYMVDVGTPVYIHW